MNIFTLRINSSSVTAKKDLRLLRMTILVLQICVPKKALYFRYIVGFAFHSQRINWCAQCYYFSNRVLCYCVNQNMLVLIVIIIIIFIRNYFRCHMNAFIFMDTSKDDHQNTGDNHKYHDSVPHNHQDETQCSASWCCLELEMVVAPLDHGMYRQSPLNNASFLPSFSLNQFSCRRPVEIKVDNFFSQEGI